MVMDGLHVLRFFDGRNDGALVWPPAAAGLKICLNDSAYDNCNG